MRKHILDESLADGWTRDWPKKSFKEDFRDDEFDDQDHSNFDPFKEEDNTWAVCIDPDGDSEWDYFDDEQEARQEYDDLVADGENDLQLYHNDEIVDEFIVDEDGAYLDNDVVVKTPYDVTVRYIYPDKEGTNIHQTDLYILRKGKCLNDLIKYLTDEGFTDINIEGVYADPDGELETDTEEFPMCEVIESDEFTEAPVKSSEMTEAMDEGVSTSPRDLYGVDSKGKVRRPDQFMFERSIDGLKNGSVYTVSYMDDWGYWHKDEVIASDAYDEDDITDTFARAEEFPVVRGQRPVTQADLDKITKYNASAAPIQKDRYGEDDVFCAKNQVSSGKNIFRLNELEPTEAEQQEYDQDARHDYGMREYKKIIAYCHKNRGTSEGGAAYTYYEAANNKIAKKSKKLKEDIDESENKEYTISEEIGDVQFIEDGVYGDHYGVDAIYVPNGDKFMLLEGKGLHDDGTSDIAFVFKWTGEDEADLKLVDYIFGATNSDIDNDLADIITEYETTGKSIE